MIYPGADEGPRRGPIFQVRRSPATEEPPTRRDRWGSNAVNSTISVPPPIEVARASAPPVLLVVEDDRTTLIALRGLFTRLGWDVRTASTVAEALGHVPLRPDGLILDLMLPDGDGLDVLREVREASPRTRVVVTTGLADGDWLDRARRLVPDSVMRKPVDFGALLRAIGPARVPG